ncbi:hypothetical protein MYW52_11470, partial [Pseudomonas juntendi]|uniref:hypothetical protein n=1 Tax=Pseudomonas juntendi TaxID=2666183 RepID=UPI001FFD6772
DTARSRGLGDVYKVPYVCCCESFKLQATSDKKKQIGGWLASSSSCKLQAASCKLQAASCKLQATSYKLQATSGKKKQIRGRLASSCDFRLSTFDLQLAASP